ncbi:MAG: hypothetical protein SPF70_09780 [Lachnospiraceae bacterium]|nr:hypothetical protein [Lachnospiraceae bacterium]
MRKNKKTIISCLVLLLTVVVLTLVNGYQEHQNTGKNLLQDNVGKNIVENGISYISLGKEVTMEGIDYIVESAEMQQEFSDEDGYYTQRGKLEPEIEFWTSPTRSEVIYEPELTYTRLTVRLQNHSGKPKAYQNMDLRIYNVENKNMGEFFDLCDFRAWNADGQEIEWEFVVEDGESITLELLYVTFLPSSYDLYLVIPKSEDNGNSKLCLSLNLVQPEKRERDLAKLKTYGDTNYDLVNLTSEGSVIPEQYFFGSDKTVGQMIEVAEMGEIYDSKKYTLLHTEIFEEYEELPESFRNRDYLKDMRSVYEERYGFAEEDLRYLVLTVKLEQYQNIQETIPVTVSQTMWLYNRKKENLIWPIGYPDDYEVSDQEENAYVHMDTYQDGTGDVHYIRAAYIIWPGALEDVYLWTHDGCLRAGRDNSYASDKGGASQELGGGIHVEID